MEDVKHRSLPVPNGSILRDTITCQATHPIPYRVLNITCPLIVRGTSRSIWISYEDGSSILSCRANPKINTALRLYTRNIVPTRYCLPRDSKSFVAALGPVPTVFARNDEPARRSIKIHHAALLHRSGTPLYTLLTNLPSFREFTTQLLMSPPACRGTSIRPHFCTRRSSRLRSSSVGSCGGSADTEVGEGGAPEGGEAGV